MSNHEKGLERLERLCEAREFWETRLEQLAGCGRLEQYAQSRLAELDQEFYALENEKAPEAAETFSQNKNILVTASV